MALNKKIIIFSALGIIVSTFTANAIYQINKLKQITTKLVGGAVKSISKSKVILRVALELDNPSDIDASIYNYDIDVYLNGNVVGKAVYDKKQYIKASSKTRIILGLNINLKQYFNIGDIIMYLSYFASDKSKLNISFKGDIKIQHAFIFKSLPIDEDFNLAELNES